MKTIIITLIALFLLTTQVDAKSRRGKKFFQSGGVTYMYAFFPGAAIGLPGITYNPRLIIYDVSRKSNLTISAKPSLAFSISTSGRGESESSFAFELPVSVDINFGHGATSRSRDSFGGYAGLGYAFNSMSYSSFDTFGNSSVSGATHGVYINGGTRFEFKEKSTTVGLYSIIGFNKQIVFGLNMLYNI